MTPGSSVLKIVTGKKTGGRLDGDPGSAVAKFNRILRRIKKIEHLWKNQGVGF